MLNYVFCFLQNNNGNTVFIPAESSHTIGGGSDRFQTSPSNINQIGFGQNNGLVNHNHNNRQVNGGNNYPVGGNGGFNNGLGQCGRRNAHGINGRVAPGRFAVNEGDTDFGKFYLPHFLHEKLPANCQF